MPDNPRQIQVSSDLEYQAVQMFLSYFQRAYLAGLLEDEWLIGVKRPHGGKMRPVVEVEARAARPLIQPEEMRRA